MEISQKPATRDPVETVIRPGVMISNAWPQSRATPGATAAAITEVLARHPFFECYQTVDIPTAKERRRVRNLLQDQGHPQTYTLTRVLGERGLSLSSLDSANRAAACQAVVAALADAEEVGASSLCVISGPRPEDPNARPQALRALEDSLTQICSAARRRAPNLEILIEPLDRDAHKRNTLGSTAEAVTICHELAERGLELKLCLDTAHLVLNDESPIDAVLLARDYIAEFHFCNCCIQREHPLFGDRHLPFGAPGIVDEKKIGIWMLELHRHGFFSAPNRPRVFCEVWKLDDTESMAVVAHCEAALQRGWEFATQARPQCR